MRLPVLEAATLDTLGQPLDELRIDQLLDLSGTLCPVPVIETAKAIRDLPPGATLLVIGTDPGIATDMPAWCRATRNELLLLRREGGALRAWIRKAAPAQRPVEAGR